MGQKPPSDRTTHWWSTELPAGPNEAFVNIANSKEIDGAFREIFPEDNYEVECIEGMNEIYVACQSGNKANSDTVFYMNHVDGPYGIFPLVHVYRCMLGATPNGQIETIFPMAGKDDRVRYTLSTGDIVGFDFHRELHRIGHVPGAPENTNIRGCMKLHYIIYPRVLGPIGRLLGRMTVHYNSNFRALFLATITPGSILAKVMAEFVLLGTLIFNNWEKYVGWANVCYLTFMGTCALFTQSYSTFFFATSFYHYFVYAATYHQRTNIAFGAFKRDALLYKSLALTQAFIQYVYRFDYSAPDFVSLGLIALGFGLAAMATKALGVDRTYFGWELGEITGGYVSSGFPYGVIPHPMIVGGIIGWLGIHKLDAFREAWPMYVPLHVCLYICHAAQEHLSVHSTGLIQKGDKLQ